ncbi:MAG: cobalamin-binding protein [Nitrospiraceae bacterium]
MRICSLLPGATEVVAALGLADELVGVSHECDYPPEVRQKPVMVRGAIDSERMSSAEVDERVRAALTDGQDLYALNETLFEQAQPDLVIAQDLCHVCAVTPGQLQRALHALPRLPEVLTLNPSRLDDIFGDIERIGTATGTVTEASALIASLRSHLTSIRDRVARASRRPRVACLEWIDPLFAAGHWVPDMVAWAGGQNMLGTAGAPSERVTWDQVVAVDPEVLVLMPCGFSIDRSRRELHRLRSNPGWARLGAVRQRRVFAVDAGSFFSRPGPRLIDGVALLAALLHPSLHGEHIFPGAERIAEC